MVLSALDVVAGPVLVAVCVLGALAVTAIWLVPRRQARRWAEQGIRGKELAELETGSRATMVQIVGGVALILTFAATWVQISDTREATNRTQELASDQALSERFTEAVGQLDSERPEIRIGGIYGLELVAREDELRRAPVAQILLAYLRQRHPAFAANGRLLASIERLPALRSRFRSKYPVCGTVVARTGVDDTQVALGVLGGLTDAARPRFNLKRLDLHAFQAPARFDFVAADLSDTFLTTAHLRGARFTDAVLELTDFTWACLRDTSFAGVTSVHGATFTGADLRGADLRRSRLGLAFRNADLRDADLTGSDFNGADFAFADLRGANMHGADLRGADLSSATLRPGGPELAGARTNRCTLMPRRPVPAECRAN